MFIIKGLVFSSGLQATKQPLTGETQQIQPHNVQNQNMPVQSSSPVHRISDPTNHVSAFVSIGRQWSYPSFAPEKSIFVCGLNTGSEMYKNCLLIIMLLFSYAAIQHGA